jgi:hypothetical protein
MNTSINEAENLLFITLLQLIVMVGAARYMHTVFRRLGQAKNGHPIPLGVEA